jgi:TRAP-type C4-dicarboxylate transport system substrate-binding protein
MRKFSFALFALLGVSLVSVQLNAASVTTFKIASMAPNGTMWMNEMNAAAKRIEKRTQGRVKFRIYPGGIMGNGKSVMRKMRVSQLQGGMMTGGELAMIDSDFNLYNLPFVFRSYDEVDYVRKRMDPLLDKSLAAKGYVSFGMTEGGFAYIMANKPITKVEDLSGMKVWIPEGDLVSQLAFEEIGVSPVQLPLSDVLTGLQTGLIDTVASSPVGTLALQWHTQVSYLTDVPLMYLYGAMIIKKRDFMKLSAGDQAIVREELNKAFANINRQNRIDDTDAREALKAQGIKFVKPDSAQVKKWVEASERSYVRLGKANGYKQATYNKMQGYLKQYRDQAKR